MQSSQSHSLRGLVPSVCRCMSNSCIKESKHFCIIAGQLQQAEQEASRWRSAASQAQAAAAKVEAEMEGLGNAYNMLETHSHDLEARIQELESTGDTLR